MHKILLQKFLPGPTNTDARALYRTLEIHFTTSVCKRCYFYRKYSVILVSGDLLDHVEDLFYASYKKSARSTDVMLDVLQKAKLIEIEEVTQRQHRLTFLHLQTKEEESIAV